MDAASYTGAAAALEDLDHEERLALAATEMLSASKNFLEGVPAVPRRERHLENDGKRQHVLQDNRVLLGVAHTNAKTVSRYLVTRMLALATQTSRALGATGKWFEHGVFGNISAGVGGDYNASPASMRKPMRSSARHDVSFKVRKNTLPARVEVDGEYEEWEQGFADAGDAAFLADLEKPVMERRPVKDIDNDHCQISAHPLSVLLCTLPLVHEQAVCVTWPLMMFLTESVCCSGDMYKPDAAAACWPLPVELPMLTPVVQRAWPPEN